MGGFIFVYTCSQYIEAKKVGRSPPQYQVKIRQLCRKCGYYGHIDQRCFSMTAGCGDYPSKSSKTKGTLKKRGLVTRDSPISCFCWLHLESNNCTSMGNMLISRLQHPVESLNGSSSTFLYITQPPARSLPSFPSLSFPVSPHLPVHLISRHTVSSPEQESEQHVNNVAVGYSPRHRRRR